MTGFHFEKIEKSCADFGVILGSEAKKKLSIYGTLLLEWNKKINLTAITDPEEVLYKHFYDCILFLRISSLPAERRLSTWEPAPASPERCLRLYVRTFR